MSADLETRMAVLEKEFQSLKALVAQRRGVPDWRSTYGMLADDDVYDEVLALGAAIRQKERDDHYH
jgi:hypothetical protein